MEIRSYQLKLPSNIMQIQLNFSTELLNDSVNGPQYIKRQVNRAFEMALIAEFDKIKEIPNNQFNQNWSFE